MASFQSSLIYSQRVAPPQNQHIKPLSTRTKRPVSTRAGRKDVAPTDDVSRRGALLGAVLIPATANVLLPRRASADVDFEVESSLYENSEGGFRLRLPKNWTVTEATAEEGTVTNRGVVVYPEGESARAVNATVVVTPVAPDFTKLGSFGSPLDFGQNMVNSMDRSFLVRSAFKKVVGNVQTAQLVDASSMRGMYYVEYKLQKPEEGRKYLESLVALSNNGRYNRLYTLTLQCPEEEIEKYQPQFNTFLKSFESVNV
ncbi:hypothetical protein BSKO_02189 [Bryopsis sp. KO-2023]|nr:hypothetical protein BSKO_02189 [Bryopsis sp. KO-2023]